MKAGSLVKVFSMVFPPPPLLKTSNVFKVVHKDWLKRTYKNTFVEASIRKEIQSF